MSGPPGKKPATAHAFTFPPFPTVPPDAVITSFKDFKERGICKGAVSGKEVDTLGIFTIGLLVQHSTDRCKTDATPAILNHLGPAKSSANASRGSGSKKREWWEEWEDFDESARLLDYNPTIPRLERFQKAVQDFNKNRAWPSNHLGVRTLWDQFQTYIGQLDSTQSRTTKKDEGEEDDFDEDHPDDNACVPPHQPSAAGANHGDIEESYSGTIDKTLVFLKNPDKSVRIFLSSHLRKQGLHFTERYLFILPKLLSAFFNYLLRNRVFADKKGDDAFREAQKTVEVALIELPLTSKLARILPDDFNGTLTVFYRIRKERDFGPVTTNDVEDIQRMAEESASNPDETNPNGFPTPTGDTGAGTSWSHPPIDTKSLNGWEDCEADTWGSDHVQADNDSVEWTLPPPRTLFPLLGPTTLPMTHQTGIVEWSVRKVKGITAPPAMQQKLTANPFTSCDAYGDPLAVEAELTSRFYKVELEPWLGWDDGSQEPEGVLPRILEASTGVVVIQEKVVFEQQSKENVGVELGQEQEKVKLVYSPTSGIKPFKPATDSISIVVLPSIGEQLRVGMGLGGTWVQLLRRGDLVGDGVQQGKKGKGKTVGQRYWYMDELTITLTSYHTV
ncbi:hypothetical protein E1B28_004871 [Marasmius oreades]|uniref:Uncharacterized protein n=1 Tax=Marasmius oreades TaxID=181124 RepID=A0A9P8ADJ3_9AGAR|nr:uncharacterized protein E1B28_004871 [Marasmius oreades]KAG7097528.1 hypothetical protein E1B28_004871 [Marasmius oreades]